MGFFDQAGGALLGGIGGSLLGGIFGNSAQKSANRTNLAIAEMNNRANRELAEYSYSKDLEQWNRQNEYNLPINQMRRYEDAGLNPNLIYGQGDNGNAKSSPSYPTPTMQGTRVEPVTAFADSFAQIGNAIGQFMNLKLTQAQIDSAKSLADKNAADAARSRAEADYTNSRNIFQGLYNNFFNESYADRLASYGLGNLFTKSRIALNDIQGSLASSQIDYNRANTRRIDNDNNIFDSITIPTLMANLGIAQERLSGLKIDNRFKPALNNSLLALRYAQRGLIGANTINAMNQNDLYQHTKSWQYKLPERQVMNYDVQWNESYRRIKNMKRNQGGSFPERFIWNLFDTLGGE